MEYQKIINLLGNVSDKLTRFITKRWIEIYDESGGTYNTNKDIRFKTLQLRSDLCDYNDAYIVVIGKITVANPDAAAYDKKLPLKNNAPFISCVTKINSNLLEDAQDLDIVMPLYNLLYYSKIIQKQLEVYGIITEMNQTEVQKEISIIESKIQNPLTTKQV